MSDRDGLWVFGYGSLVWRPAFPFAERHPGSVRGWSRRFWQASTDHRGVPEAPGRVATVIRDPAALCWGMAYRVQPGAEAEVLATLDHREKGGYERHEVLVRLRGLEREQPALMYVAGPDNPQYTGPAPLAEVAAIVRRSVGPSGTNHEYVTRLAEALRSLEVQDAHVFALARLVCD